MVKRGIGLENDANKATIDASSASILAGNLLDAACKAVMQLAMVALNANGYRTMTSKPGRPDLL
jgi:hypothetical protein